MADGDTRRVQRLTNAVLRARIEPLLDEYEAADGRRAFMLIRWADHD